jgi:MFS transporter, SP family, inositol transporter
MRKPFVGSILFLTGMYGVWNLMAGTNGFHLPYILRTVGDQGQAMSVGLQCASFLLVALGVALVFMPFVDRVNQRAMFAVGALPQVVALLLVALFPLTLGSPSATWCSSGSAVASRSSRSSSSGAARCSRR